MKYVKCITATVTAFALSLSLFTTIYAESGDTASIGIQQTEISEKLPIFDKLLQKIPIDKDSIPALLDIDRLKSQGFISRLKSEEKSMCEIVLEKDDGTKALYLFDSPVKYIDEDGNTIDKSNKAVRKGSTFKSKSNDIDVILPAVLSSGIIFNDDELKIIMRPMKTANIGRIMSVGMINNEDSVLYKDVFDKYTDIEYTYNYDGVKEDIILEKYNDKNTFDFEVTTGGLTLYEDKGTLLLSDASGKVKASLGEVVVSSGDNKNNTFGNFEITEKVKNNSYIVTVSVDKEYLTSPDTVYPVRIDPTIKSTSTDVGIEDLQVFKGTDGSGDNETSAGKSGVSRVGWSDWGTCRTLMKFTGLNFSGKQITQSSQITEAYVEMRDLMCQGGTAVPIVCSQFTGNAWSESDIKTWNQLNADSTGTSSAIVGVTYGNGNSPTNRSDKEHWYRWDITKIVKQWVGNGTYRNRGVVFKTFNSFLEDSPGYSQCMKTFGSMQGDSRYKPYFCIEYCAIPVSSISISKTSATLNVEQSTQLSATVYPSNATNKTVKWSSSDTAVATVDSTGKVTAKRAGKATITAKSYDGNCKSSCNVIVKQVLTYPDTIITDTATKNKIILLKTLKDSNAIAYIHGDINLTTKYMIDEELDNELNIARADYIVSGNNATSEYAYQVLGGDKNSAVPSSFSRTLRLNSTGLDVIVVQRALEVLGYYEPLEGYNYGTFDVETLEAASSYSCLLSNVNGELVFDNLSFNVLFQAANMNNVTIKNMTALNQSRATHDEVVMWTAAKVGGTTDRNSNRIAQGGINYKDKEKKIRYDGYADILKDIPTSGTFLWEVKPDKTRYYSGQAIGLNQIQRYLNAGNNPNIQQNFTKPLMCGYYIEPYSFISSDGYYIDVRSPTEYGNGRALILYYKNTTKGDHNYSIETSAKKVEAKDYEYKITYNYSYSNEVLGSVLVMGVVIVGGVVCVALAPATGGASMIVPLAGCV